MSEYLRKVSERERERKTMRERERKRAYKRAREKETAREITYLNCGSSPRTL